MRTAIALGLGVLLLGIPARADETPVKGKIVAADLFKNGLAVVTCEVTLGRPGAYVLDNVPELIHGTYWAEGGAPVETVVKTREVEVPADQVAPGDLQEDLAGRAVTVHFRGDRRPPVAGTVMRFKPARAEAVGPAGWAAAVAAPAPRYLVLQTGKGRTYIDASEVAAVEAADAGATVRRAGPRLLLTLGATDRPETRVTLRYLTRGLAWAPSYKVDITDPKTLTLEQHAVVRNEMADLDGADVRLISGYPSVQFAHVRSPLSPGATWTAFFQELASRTGRDTDVTSNAVVGQQAVMNFRASPLPLGLGGAIPTGEGVDLHYQPIGKRTLAAGEALALAVARGTAPYERVVEWVIPDTRDEHGRHAARDRGDGEADAGDAWDALRFKNPLGFAMTTGPATVTSGGRFNGQRTSYWVNAGEETVLRVGKALSVRTRAVEHERQPKDGGQRDLVWVGGREYRRVKVAGEVAVGNHRKEAVTVVIRRRFSGELESAEGAPAESLREEGVFSVNRRNELVWAVPLAAGAERTLKYAYSVLVPN